MAATVERAPQTEPRGYYDVHGSAEVAGMGLINPNGHSLPEVWKNVIDGKSAISRIDEANDGSPIRRESLDRFARYSKIKIEIAGLVRGWDAYKDLVETNVVTKSEFNYLSDPEKYALKSAFEALLDADLLEPYIEEKGRIQIHRWRIKPELADDVEIIGATGVGGSVESGVDVYRKLEAGQTADVPDIFRGLPARIATVVSLAFKNHAGASIRGAECASGNYAQRDALDGARNKNPRRPKIFVVVGAEGSIIPEAINMFEVETALSTATDPEKAPLAMEDPQSETFKKYKGFVMGEGGATIVYWDPDYARSRGLRTKYHTQLAGYAQTTDGHSPIFPHPEGIYTRRAMDWAIEDAGGIPDDAGVYTNGHTTGTPADVLEANLIHGVTKRFTKKHLSGTKPMNGHLLGAAGVEEAIYCIQAVETGIIPPSIKSENPDPVAVEAGLVRNEALLAPDTDTAISNGLGFGGTNATLVFKRR